MAQPDAKAMKNLVQQGKAMPPKPGSGSTPGRFPVRNADELAKAIQAVGRVRPNTDEARARVRRFIIARAKALNLSSQIPDSWDASGNLKP